MKNRIKVLLKNKYLFTIVQFFYHLFTILRMLVFKLASLPLILTTQIDDNLVVFSNYAGKGFYDNPKFIAIELKKIKPSLELIWLTNEVDLIGTENEYVKFRKNTKINQLKILTKSKIWVDNSRKHFIPIKRKKQIYIQTWHGGLGIKKVELSNNKVSFINKFVAKNDNSAIDFMISNSKHLSQRYRGEFQYEGEILELGYPVNDSLFNEEVAFKKYTEYFTILYAPTYRPNLNPKEYIPNLNAIQEYLSETLNIDVTIILRIHPNITLDDMTIFKNENIINGNVEKDFNKLLRSADLIISDYSSVLLNAMIIKKKAIIYAPDYESYSKNPGLNLDILKLPFPVTFTEFELMEEIVAFDEEKYLSSIKKIIDDFGLVDEGNSSENVAKFITGLLD